MQVIWAGGRLGLDPLVQADRLLRCDRCAATGFAWLARFPMQPRANFTRLFKGQAKAAAG
jgi:hypothetical protein